ncbi:MAG: pirin family protein [Candidatus Gracilibacteria bacterium]|nr:pirin family protein [Candidatus Gracilibacteria bacterium]
MKNKIIPSNQVYRADHGWLKTSHIFSFADYYDPQNMGFGNMRVFNDDFIGAKTGFGFHPHSNMEILTVILEGEITHGDNLGNKETISVGEIQTMSAGTGILHSEENLSNKETHLYQIWFLPNSSGNKPSYKDQKVFLVKNKLNLLASGNKEDKVGFLDSNVLVYRGIFKKGNKFNYFIDKKKGLFIYVYKGKIEVFLDNNGKKETLLPGDQLRYMKKGTYDFEASEDCDFMLIEVAL